MKLKRVWKCCGTDEVASSLKQCQKLSTIINICATFSKNISMLIYRKTSKNLKVSNNIKQQIVRLIFVASLDVEKMVFFKKLHSKVESFSRLWKNKRIVRPHWILLIKGYSIKYFRFLSQTFINSSN